MSTDTDQARRLWQALEPLHAVAYFAPRCTEALTDLGLKGFWMSYFGGRFAPLGAVGAGPVTALAFGFAPRRVERAVPDAWDQASPADIVDARLAAATASLHELPAQTTEGAAELADLLHRAQAACSFDGRALAAAWADVDAPDDPLGQVWLSASVLREHRGDGHVAAAIALGLSGLDTNLTFVGTGVLPRQILQSTRAWTDDEWDVALANLVALGLLDGDGRLTEAGRSHRRQLEATTDALAVEPAEAIGPEGVARVVELARPMSRHLIDSGLVPIPNPIGAPRP